MEKLTISSFKYGLDTRRTELTSNPGTLENAENGYIDAGGVFRKRLAFIPFSNLAILDTNGSQGTFGFQDTDTGPMTFGSAIVFEGSVMLSQPNLASAMPTTSPQIVYQQLKHPEVVDGTTYNAAYHRMTKAVSIAYAGKAYVAATFTDLKTYLYYNGTLVESSRNGIVQPSSTSLASLGTDLARQVNLLDSWVASANTTGMAYSGSATPQAIQALTGSGTGATMNLTVVAGLITASTIVAGGVGYAAGDIFTVVDATGMGALFQVFSVSAGAIQTYLTLNTGAVAQNGTDVIASPPGSDFTAVAEENSTSGSLGSQLVDRSSTGFPAKAASVAFVFTNLASGTITITAFSDAVGTVAVTLVPSMLVTGSFPQLDIVNTINRGTMFHGYTATLGATPGVFTVTITAPVAFGNVTFNMSAVLTGAAAISATTVAGAFAVSVLPVNPTASVTSKKKATVSVTAAGASINGGGTSAYAWAETGVASGIAISSPTGPSVTFSKALVQGDNATGVFKCTATDNTGTTTSISFTVSLSNNFATTV